MNFYRFIIVLIVFWQCTNPFSTRDPEEPDESGNLQGYEDARTPEILLSNFEKALKEKNTVEYVNCFANPVSGHKKTYAFEPDARLVVDFQLFPNWSTRDEESYFLKLTEEERADFPQILFSTLDEPEYRPINLAAPDDSVETNIFRYLLTVVHIDSEKVYSGQMRFRAFQARSTDSNWYLYYWSDYANKDDYESTWSFLKLENR